MDSFVVIFVTELAKFISDKNIKIILPGNFDDVLSDTGLTVPVTITPQANKRLSEKIYKEEYIITLIPTTRMRENDGHALITTFADTVKEVLYCIEKIIIMPPECKKWWIDTIQTTQAGDDNNQSIGVSCLFNCLEFH
ncbi:MAG: hypothetical protein LBT46_15475 [Planctomycetaceae bacterium]|jgi:hypothetical protein|nr:hypothetical protein [Planctomycetaceae bacterium]